MIPALNSQLDTESAVLHISNALESKKKKMIQYLFVTGVFELNSLFIGKKYRKKTG